MKKKYVLHDSEGKAFSFTDREQFEKAARILSRLDAEYQSINEIDELFLAEMGTGPNAWRLPAPYWKEYDNL